MEIINDLTIMSTNSIWLELWKFESNLGKEDYPLIFQWEYWESSEIFFKSWIKNDLYYVLLWDWRIFHFDEKYYKSLQEACLIDSFRIDEALVDQIIRNKKELIRLQKSILDNKYKDEREVSDEEHEKMIQEYHKCLIPHHIESMLEIGMRDVNNPEDMKSHLKWINYVYENNVYLKQEKYNNLHKKVEDRLKKYD